jgi:hypothetical protein
MIKKKIPVWGRFSVTVQIDLGVQPHSCTVGNLSLSLAMQPGLGVEYPPRSNANIKGRVELYL